MKRRHLFEWEDQQWFPAFIRNYMTDFLQFVSNRFDLYRETVPWIIRGVEASGTGQIIDLASGGGGGWRKLLDHVHAENPDIRLMLTDYYPNERAFKRMADRDERISYELHPISALDVPRHLKGLRTMFLSFHHFRPDDARKILQNAIDSKQPIAVFEAQKRNVEHFVKFSLSPINVLLSTPFIRPFRIGRLIFTYLIPLVPLFTLWDGLVSVLRTYSVHELRALVESLHGSDRFEWEIGQRRRSGVTIIYLLGIPKSSG